MLPISGQYFYFPTTQKCIKIHKNRTSPKSQGEKLDIWLQDLNFKAI